MNGFLEEITGMDNFKSELTEYNYNFFEKYVDKNLLSDLLDLCHYYVHAIENITRRNNPSTLEQLEKLGLEIRQLENEMDEILSEQNTLCDKKNDVCVSRRDLYNSNIDFAEAQRLSDLDNSYNVFLDDNDKKLKALLETQKPKIDEVAKIQAERIKCEAIIESSLENVRLLLAELDGQNLQIFNAGIEEIMEDYSTGLAEILPNDQARETYIAYLFDSLQREASMVLETYITAHKFAYITSKEKDYIVPELNTKNNQIAFNHNITNQLKIMVQQFFGVGCKDVNDNEKITNASQEYLTKKSYVDDIYTYIDNLEAYETNPELARIQYYKIKSVANDSMGKRSSKDFFKNIPHILVCNLFGTFNYGVKIMSDQDNKDKQSSIHIVK